jgi:hypothetical protein
VEWLCSRHHGLTRVTSPAECAVDGCTSRPHARGYCPMHYQRLKKHGDPGEAERRWSPRRGAKAA